MIIRADARSIPLRDGCVQTCISSPPYWGLRSYGIGTENGEIGLEKSPDEYVATMVSVFREVRRVLRDDGTVWLNLGDSFWNHSPVRTSAAQAFETVFTGGLISDGPAQRRRANGHETLKMKDLCGMPWRVAFALQADGWWLRSDIVWAKPNPMPESVTDRPTRSHEYIFLLAKSERYFYDADAIREPSNGNAHPRGNGLTPKSAIPGSGIKANASFHTACNELVNERNKRDVWTVNSEPTPEAHFATFPQALITPCILAGTSEKGCCAVCGAPRVRVTEREKPPESVFTRRHAPEDELIYSGSRVNGEWKGHGQKLQNWLNEHPAQTVGWRPSCSHDAPAVPCLVLDPFLGSGTVGKVCERLGRRWAGLELSAEYIGIARSKTAQRGLFNFGGGNGQAERGHRNRV